MDPTTILLDIIYHEMGVVSMVGQGVDINKFLAGLPTEQARALKRKFRKAWRKAMNSAKTKRQKTYYNLHAEPGKQIPSKHNKSFRKTLVQMTAIRALMKVRENIDKVENQ